MNLLKPFDIATLRIPIRLPKPFLVNSGTIALEDTIRPTITSDKLNETFRTIIGGPSESYPISLRIFELILEEGDRVVVQSAEQKLPLIILRANTLIVNFDFMALQSFSFTDSKRPIYTYIPGFNGQMIPSFIRRPISNLAKSLSISKSPGALNKIGRLPLTDFDFMVLLLHEIMTENVQETTTPYNWPSGKRAVFISLHDVDTDGFLKRGDHDPLFKLEQKHQIQSTWFITTKTLKKKNSAIDFILQSGHEIGWHGHAHDHRLPFKPYAERRSQILQDSLLGQPNHFPVGMRTPKLLKSNHLYNALERRAPSLCYDTSFPQGIVPYNLWVHGQESTILEIPTTIPAEIYLYNVFRHIPEPRRFDMVLETQIARTKQLIDTGGIISIVTHPEEDLSERTEFLHIYDKYLAFVKSCPDIWFTTAGELYKYWTYERAPLKTRESHLQKFNKR